MLESFNPCAYTYAKPYCTLYQFQVFDMGSKLSCENDYVEILEENDDSKFVSIKTYCGDDNPAVYTSSRSTLKIHHMQTVHFPGTGWIIHFMGIKEGRHGDYIFFFY
jgi:CUB domain